MSNKPSSLTNDDWDDIQLSHGYRLSLQTKPSQSSFRVLALIFYELLEPLEESNLSRPFQWIPRITKPKPSTNKSIQNEDDGPDSKRPKLQDKAVSGDVDRINGRMYVVGTNDECGGYIGGAICAERAGLVQLRFAPPHRITKIVICTDSIDPISPGMLCREFLAGHGGGSNQQQQILPWDLPILSTGCLCHCCSKQNEDLFSKSSDGTVSFQCTCKSNNDGNNLNHGLSILQTTLQELYPYPSPYLRLTATESVQLGKKYCQNQNDEQLDRELEPSDDTSIIRNLIKVAMSQAKKQQLKCRGHTKQNDKENSNSDDSDSDEIHPIYFGSAVQFQNGSIITGYQWNALEYGCSLDAVSQLATQIGEQTTKTNFPIWLVQVDQYGIAHAPFAPARAFLTEHGFGSCKVILHDTNNDDGTATTTTTDDVSKWKLINVKALELAPNSPSWCSGTER